jgi:hypothetical protein
MQVCIKCVHACVHKHIFAVRQTRSCITGVCVYVCMYVRVHTLDVYVYVCSVSQLRIRSTSSKTNGFSLMKDSVLHTLHTAVNAILKQKK